jgi:hypothetical protein
MAISAAVLGLFTFLIVDEDEEDDFRVAVSSKWYRCLSTHIAAEYLETHTTVFEMSLSFLLF